MIGSIIDIINNNLSGWHSDEIFYGVAESILRTSGSVITKLPGIVHSNGEIKYVGIDDIKSIIGYHKLNSISTTQLTNGNGDSFGDIRNVYNMSLFIYWDANKINSINDTALFIAQSRLPLGIHGIKDIKNVVIRLVNANLNTYQIYRQEYEFEEIIPLPENKRIIQINYNAEITFKPECFRQCPECP